MDSSISSEKEWEVCNKKMKNIKQYLDLTFWKFILVGIINTLVGTTVMFVAYNLCLSLIHILLWLIVVNIDDPVTTQTFNNIPVAVTNAEVLAATRCV